MVKQNVYWCPTIYVGAYVAEGRGGIWPRMVELERIAFGKALKKRVRISYGTDAGGYAWTENQGKELSYMVKYGMTPMQAIQSATSVGAQLLDQQDSRGAVEPRKFPDIAAVSGDPRTDITELDGVTVVMNAGAAMKR